MPDDAKAPDFNVNKENGDDFTLDSTDTIEPLTIYTSERRYGFGIMSFWAVGAFALTVGLQQLIQNGSPCGQSTSCQYNQIVHLSVGLFALFFAIIIFGIGFLLEYNRRIGDEDLSAKEEQVLEKAMLELEEQALTSQEITQNQAKSNLNKETAGESKTPLND